ncbi:MAG TPA: hypothetical protein VNA69_03620 [Thermoanaerobaculia bacterium]|nr:hypothetical protein [Thermoanaerobaculia bacterium]
MRRALPPLLAIAAFAAAGILWIIGDRRAAQRIYDTYSSANTSDTGLSLAAGYLRGRREVAMLTRPAGRETLPRDAVVFRLTREIPLMFDPEELAEKQVGPPKPKLSPLLGDAEEAFVRGGGRMILASPLGLLPSAALVSAETKKVFPLWPNAGDFTCKCTRAFMDLQPRMHAIFASGAQTLLARQRIGAGELFVLSAPEMFANAHLAQPNHLELLEALAGERRPVYFDEVPHGIVSDDGALALMKDWNLGPFLLLLLAVAALVFWRRGRRIGPAEDDQRETRSDAIDLVRSLGTLYEKVTSDADAIALYHEALTRTVASRTGLRGDALRKRVDDLTGGFVPPARWDDLSPAVFREHLETLNQAFQGVK